MDVIRFFETSVTGKALFIGALILTLLVPLGMIERLIAERGQRHDAASAAVASTLGSQTIGGPILVVPFRLVSSNDPAATDELYLLPEELGISSDSQTHPIARGIYQIPVYEAHIEISGRFADASTFTRNGERELLWDQAVIALPLGDFRSLREPVRFTAGGMSTPLQRGGMRVPGFGQQLVARYADLGVGALTAPLEFSIDVKVGGSNWLGFLPLGSITRVTMTSDWPSPSFRGAYLPEHREVNGQGFSANWTVLDVGRAFPPRWKRSDPVGAVSGDSSEFGAALIDPVGVHEATLRATKYGVLLIGLCFATYFAFELLASLRLHALHYLLIGMANCVFYLLLLALAEQIGFGFAYLASAGGSAALITLYSVSVLRSVLRALPIGALLAALYSYLYVTLRAEDYALLLGALGTFGALAAIMYLTRHVDWHAVRIGSIKAMSHELQTELEDAQEGV
jgi:inner membrane protein